jgi:hypothetical protein
VKVLRTFALPRRRELNRPAKLLGWSEYFHYSSTKKMKI